MEVVCTTSSGGDAFVVAGTVGVVTLGFLGKVGGFGGLLGGNGCLLLVVDVVVVDVVVVVAAVVVVAIVGVVAVTKGGILVEGVGAASISPVNDESMVK